jgi:dethiobiotin synthetase
VTGTDTGVGKTLLTASLLFHLRTSGVKCLAMKPFCSGGTADVELLQAIQGRELARKEVNPFYFREALAPLVAARAGRQNISLQQALDSIERVRERCEVLLVEGSGGVLVPLGERFNVADLIARLNCEVMVAARNKLGTINHTALTVEALRSRGVGQIKVVLMGQKEKDLSIRSNAAVISKTVGNIKVFAFPYLGRKAASLSSVIANAKKIKKVLVPIFDSAILSPRSLEPL